MSRAAVSDAFEQFQGRVWRVAAVVAGIVLAGVLVGRMGYTPVAGGLAVGFAASLVCHALKVRSLRRLRQQARRAGRSRAALAAVGRIGVYGAALAAAAGTEQVEFLAAAGGLLLVNGVTIAMAVASSRRPVPDG